MPEINLPTAGKQDTILANTNAINSNVNSVNTNVNANKSTLATVNANLGTPTSGASNATDSNAHAKLNYILNKTSKNLLSSSPILGNGMGLLDYNPHPNTTYNVLKFSITGACAIFNLKLTFSTSGPNNSSIKVTIDGKTMYFNGTTVSTGLTVVTLPFIAITNGITIYSNYSPGANQSDYWGVSYSHYHLL